MGLKQIACGGLKLKHANGNTRLQRGKITICWMCLKVLLSWWSLFVILFHPCTWSLCTNYSTAPILEKQIQSWFCAAIFGFNKAISPSQLVNRRLQLSSCLMTCLLWTLDPVRIQKQRACLLTKIEKNDDTILPAANSAGSYRRLSMIWAFQCQCRPLSLPRPWQRLHLALCLALLNQFCLSCLLTRLMFPP